MSARSRRSGSSTSPCTRPCRCRPCPTRWRIFWTPSLWPSSVVRMKKSLEMFSGLPLPLKLAREPVGQRLRGDALLRRGLRAICSPCSSVPVRKKTSSPAAGGAGQDVGDDRRVGVPDVRRGVDVVDRRRDVERSLGLFPPERSSSDEHHGLRPLHAGFFRNEPRTARKVPDRMKPRFAPRIDACARRGSRSRRCCRRSVEPGRRRSVTATPGPSEPAGTGIDAIRHRAIFLSPTIRTDFAPSAMWLLELPPTGRRSRLTHRVVDVLDEADHFVEHLVLMTRRFRVASALFACRWGSPTASGHPRVALLEARPAGAYLFEALWMSAASLSIAVGSMMVPSARRRRRHFFLAYRAVTARWAISLRATASTTTTTGRARRVVVSRWTSCGFDNASALTRTFSPPARAVARTSSPGRRTRRPTYGVLADRRRSRSSTGSDHNGTSAFASSRPPGEAGSWQP